MEISIKGLFLTQTGIKLDPPAAALNIPAEKFTQVVTTFLMNIKFSLPISQNYTSIRYLHEVKNTKQKIIEFLSQVPIPITTRANDIDMEIYQPLLRIIRGKNKHVNYTKGRIKLQRNNYVIRTERVGEYNLTSPFIKLIVNLVRE